MEFLTLLFLILIIIASSISIVPKTVPEVLCHIIGYLIFTLLLLNTLKKRLSLVKTIVIGTIIVILLGIIIEIYQHFIPVRAFEIIDIIANCTGTILGAVFFVVILKAFKKNKDKIK